MKLEAQKLVKPLLVIGLVQILSGCSIWEQIKKTIAREKAIDIYNSSVDELNSEKYKLAYPKLVQAQEMAPDDPMINTALGKALVGIGKPEQGVSYLEKALTEDKKYSSAYMGLANAYESMGKYGKAADSFELFLKQRPADASPMHKDKIKALRKQQAFYDRVSKLAGGMSSTDYFCFATADEGIRRWPSSSMPLTIQVDISNNLKALHPNFHNIVMKACSDWEKGSAGEIKIVRAKSSKKSKIRCRLTDNPADLSKLSEQGETVGTNNLSGLIKAEIKILCIDRETGKQENDQQIYLTTLHELGHALGIDGHSPEPGDIMYFSRIHRAEDRPALSDRDKQTLKMLYKTELAYMPPKGSAAEKTAERISTYNKNIKIYNAAVADYNAKRYADAIAKANEFLLLEPKSKIAKHLICISNERLQAASKPLKAQGQLPE